MDFSVNDGSYSDGYQSDDLYVVDVSGDDFLLTTADGTTYLVDPSGDDVLATGDEVAEMLSSAGDDMVGQAAGAGSVTTSGVSFSSMSNLGEVGPLLDEVNALSAQVQAEVPAIDPYRLPVSGDTAALMSQINTQMTQAQQLVDSVSSIPVSSIPVSSIPPEVSGSTAGTVGLPPISPAVQNTLDMIHNTMNADPDTLSRMNSMLMADISYNETLNSVRGHEALVQSQNDTSRVIQDADQAIIESQAARGT